MSAVGQTRQQDGRGWHTAWRVATWPARALRLLLGAVLVVALLLALGAIGLAWRLAQGTLDVTWLVRRVEAVAAPDDAARRIRVGSATLAWNGFNAGAHSGLEIQLYDVSTTGPVGGPGASVAQAGITLAPLPLLSATVAPRRIVLDDVRLRAVRATDGRVRLGFDAGSGGEAGGAGLPDLLAELRRPGSGLGDLREVSVEHARITLLDEGTGNALEGDVANLQLRRREAGGITGAAEARFEIGGGTVAVSLQADIPAGGGTHVDATLSPLGIRTIDTAALTRLAPSLAILGHLDTTLQARASLDLSPALLPDRATLHVSAASGTLSVPASAPVAFERLSVALAATWDGGSWRPSTVKLDPAEIVLVAGGSRRTTVRMTADAARPEGRYVVETALGLDRASFADLASLWPAAWGGHVRPWLTENITAGTAYDGAFTARIEAPEANPGAARLVAAGGTLQADEAVVHWLRPVPPIEHARAVLTMTGPDALVIAVPHATQGTVALRDGEIHFTGLSQKDQYMALAVNLQGSVPDVLKLLKNPRLELLSKHPLPITGSAGKVAARLSVELPLLENVTIDQVLIGSTGRLTGLRLGGLIAGRDLDHGDVTYDVTQDGLKAAGTLAVAGVPGQAEVTMNFKAGPPTEILEQAKFVGRIGQAELAANGVDTGGMLTGGAALVTVTYAEQRDGIARVSATADLGPAGLSVAGWRKPPGPAAQASATVLLTHGKLSGVPHLAANGPGLAIVAHAGMIDGQPRRLHLERVVLGPTRLSGEVVFPADTGGPIRIQASGPAIDLSSQVGDFTSAGKIHQSWIIDVRFGRVMLGHGRTLTDVAVQAEHLDGRLQTLNATTGGEERLRASITPIAGGRRLLVQAADTGALLSGLDVTRTIGNGILAIDGTFDDRSPGAPLIGRLRLGGFGVRDAVIIGKLLQAITIYGIVDAVRDKGVYFADMQMPFSFEDNVLRVGPSRASSASLGLTAHGWIDFNRKLMDLDGTVVPAYAVNAALGRLPWVGRLFSPERGGGLIAVNFTVSGPTADPDVSINPLSLLTPGFLRRLFDLFS